MNTTKTTTGAIRKTEQKIVTSVERRRQAVFERFPLLFTLLGSFGLVATFYGFEGLIDRFDLLANNPLLILITGLLVLAGTGSLYKKLQ
jgi:hypothetical protein